MHFLFILNFLVSFFFFFFFFFFLYSFILLFCLNQVGDLVLDTLLSLIFFTLLLTVCSIRFYFFRLFVSFLFYYLFIYFTTCFYYLVIHHCYLLPTHKYISVILLICSPIILKVYLGHIKNSLLLI